MAFPYDIGFLGGGQLARMSIQAAQRMGFRCLSLDPGSDTPASQVADALVGNLDDVDKIAEIFRSCERVTLENEFIPADAIREAIDLAGAYVDSIVPGIETLATIQDKLLQRQAMAAAGVPSPKAVQMTIAGEAVMRIGVPLVMKTRFGGYDGKGVIYAKSHEAIHAHRGAYQDGGWLAEEFVPFKRELAVMVFAGADEMGCFPTMETVQANHVCDLVYPCEVDASEVAMAAVRAVNGRGLFGVELFELEDGSILVNELAPRPHNTGHYTLDWGGVSQFEQHVRLVMGLPMGNAKGEPVCMVNLLGQEGTGDYRQAVGAAMEDPGAHFHWYGKAESRRGRKMGHINVRRGEDLVERARAAQERFYKAWTV